MKFWNKALITICLTCTLIGNSQSIDSHFRLLNSTNPVDAAVDRTMHLMQPLWICFEEDNKIYMHGCIRDMSQGPLEDFFTKGIALKVMDSTGDKQAFHGLCTTNVQIFTNYVGTIQIGTNFLTVSNLLTLTK